MVTGSLFTQRSVNVILKSLFYPLPESLLQLFRSMKRRHYLRLTPRDLEHVTLNENMAQTKPRENLMALSVYFDKRSNFSHYQALLTFLSATLDPKYINEDLSVPLRKRSGKRLRVSVIDYIHSLIEPITPTHAINLLHRFLCRSITYPQYLILNPKMK